MNRSCGDPYHANLNPDPGETLTPEQWEQAADILERELGFAGQPRVVVEHEKAGRVHRHVVWSRIDADTLTARPDGLTYRKHERAAREIERILDHQAVASVLVKDRKTPRPPRNPSGWESFRGQGSNRDPKTTQAEVTALWHAADTSRAFAAALQTRGYILARGDRRDFCIIDAAGDEHSLARRISGVNAAGIRARMADIDRTALPSVAEARALARAGSGGGSAQDAAVAQMRAATAQLTRQLRRAPPQPSLRRQPPPRFTPARDAAMARAQMRQTVLPFVEAICTLGHVPELVIGAVETGIGWIDRATHYLAELAEDVRATVAGAVGWHDHVHGAHGTLDPGRGHS